MGKLELFNIVYTTQPPVFFAGQAVTGVVNIKLKDGMKMRNIRLNFKGEAKVNKCNGILNDAEYVITN